MAHQLTGSTIASTFEQLIYRTTTEPGAGTTTTQLLASENDQTDDLALPLYIGTERIGIGTATPATQLEIGGPVGTGFGCAGILTLSTVESTIAVDTTDVLGAILFQAYNEGDGSAAILPAAAIWAEAEADFEVGANKCALVFATAAGETAKQAGNERMRINRNGKVGIGISDPSALLTVGDDNTLITDGTTAVTSEGMNLSIDEASAYAMGIKNDNASGDGLIIQAGDASDDYALRVEDYDSANDLLVVRGDGKVGIGTAGPGSPLSVVDARTGTNDIAVSFTHLGVERPCLQLASNSGTFSGTYGVLNLQTDRASNSAFTFLSCRAGDGATLEAYINGQGILYAHSATVETVDYAEFFESSNGESIPLGTTVLLIDGKVRASKEGETPFGVVSSTLGNGTAWSSWNNKYLKDDYSQYILEDDPNIEDKSKLREGDDGKRRKLNPDYNESKKYVSREHRDEWNSIGLLGQVPITKGQPVASSWIKMWEVSDDVDMYYIFPCPQIVSNN